MWDELGKADKISGLNLDDLNHFIQIIINEDFATARKLATKPDLKLALDDYIQSSRARVDKSQTELDA